MSDTSDQFNTRPTLQEMIGTTEKKEAERKLAWFSSQFESAGDGVSTQARARKPSIAHFERFTRNLRAMIEAAGSDGPLSSPIIPLPDYRSETEELILEQWEHGKDVAFQVKRKRISQEERKNAKLPAVESAWNQAGFVCCEPLNASCYGRVGAAAEAQDVESLMNRFKSSLGGKCPKVEARTSPNAARGGLGRQWIMMLVVFVQLMLIQAVGAADLKEVKFREVPEFQKMPQDVRESIDAFFKGDLDHLKETISFKDAHLKPFRREAFTIEAAAKSGGTAKFRPEEILSHDHRHLQSQEMIYFSIKALAPSYYPVTISISGPDKHDFACSPATAGEWIPNVASQFYTMYSLYSTEAVWFYCYPKPGTNPVDFDVYFSPFLVGEEPSETIFLRGMNDVSEIDVGNENGPLAVYQAYNLDWVVGFGTGYGYHAVRYGTHSGVRKPVTGCFDTGLGTGYMYGIPATQTQCTSRRELQTAFTGAVVLTVLVEEVDAAAVLQVFSEIGGQIISLATNAVADLGEIGFAQEHLITSAANVRAFVFKYTPLVPDAVDNYIEITLSEAGTIRPIAFSAETEMPVSLQVTPESGGSYGYVSSYDNTIGRTRLGAILQDGGGFKVDLTPIQANIGRVYGTPAA